jgi:ectoine hydroxylase-related dioxygenase (phytanoyl-CoA dioxygenase family)
VISPGYDIVNGVISPGECDKLLEQVATLTAHTNRAGIRGLMLYPWVRSIAHDSRLTELAERVCGRNLKPYKAMLFRKTSKADWLVAWHQDTALPIDKFVASAGWSSPSMKAGQLFAHAPASALENIVALRVQLDASTAMNGPLRVIPGSHSFGILGDGEIRELVQRSSAVKCLTGRGGVIVMSPLLLHSSSKLVNNLPRRVLHIEYAESLELEDGVKLCIS